MTKPAPTYVEQLAAWVRESPAPRPRQDKNLAAFLAVKADVQAALAARFPVKTIWAHLRETGRIKCRYETFLTHVKLHTTEQPAPHEAEAPTGSTAPAPAPVPETGPHRTEASVPGFNFKPAPDKKDLIG
jgi:hypothetical protein